MRRLILFLLGSLVCIVPIPAQDNHEIKINSAVNTAKIYLNGAELQRSVSIDLVKGNNLLVFAGLSSMLNAKSIRVSADKEISVLRISTKTDYLTIAKELPLIQILKDSIQLTEIKKQAISDELSAYESEKLLLEKNNSIGGTTNGLAVSELKQAADFYRERMLEINKKTSSLNFASNKQNSLLLKLRNQLMEVNSRSSEVKTNVLVLISSAQNTKVNFKLKYIVSQAGWVPAYEIKAIDLNKPIGLIYKAKVFNNTGVPWRDIQISLSTADPDLSITKPDLKPWYLDYYSNNSKLKMKNEGYVQNMISQEMIEDIAYEEDLDEDIAYTEIDIPELSTEFAVAAKYSIPADDKPYLIEINKHSLDASYKHFAVTKIDKGVFLLGRITGWQDLNMVDGYANVYFKGTYLGESFIKTRNVSDTLDLSLGRDEKVIVTRTKLKNFSSKQMIGSKLKETLSYEMVAKNNRNISVDIEIVDQIPISQNSEIEVKVLEVSDAEMNMETGKLKWRFKLAAGQSKKLRLSFSIKYPKGMTVPVQQMKKRAVRKF